MTWDTTAATHATSAGAWLATSQWAIGADGDDDAAGSAGVREPRRPIQPANTTGATLALPDSHDDAACGSRAA